MGTEFISQEIIFLCHLYKKIQTINFTCPLNKWTSRKREPLPTKKQWIVNRCKIVSTCTFQLSKYNNLWNITLPKGFQPKPRNSLKTTQGYCTPSNHAKSYNPQTRDNDYFDHPQTIRKLAVLTRIGS